MLTNSAARRVMVLLALAELEAKTRIRDFSAEGQTRISVFAFVSRISRRGCGVGSTTNAVGFVMFAQQDTYEGQVLSPPSLHQYVYTLNDPVRYTDSSGNSPCNGVVVTKTQVSVAIFSIVLDVLALVAAVFAVLFIANPLAAAVLAIVSLGLVLLSFELALYNSGSSVLHLDKNTLILMAIGVAAAIIGLAPGAGLLDAIAGVLLAVIALVIDWRTIQCYDANQPGSAPPATDTDS